MMKFLLLATVCMIVVSTSNGFKVGSNHKTITTKYSTMEDTLESNSTPPPRVALPAKWLPIGGMKAPKALDGSLAGDVGFDPLG